MSPKLTSQRSNAVMLSSAFSEKLGIDFSFNTIKTVKKVNWKNEAPWYREISDGLSWIGYCFNSECEAYKEMVVINRGYSAFSIKDIFKLICPVCKTYPSKG